MVEMCSFLVKNILFLTSYLSGKAFWDKFIAGYQFGYDFTMRTIELYFS